MPIKIIYVPPQHLTTDAGVKFDTYRFYLQCISRLLDSEYSDWQGLVKACAKSTKALQGAGNVDINWIDRFLKIAWNTEYLLYVDSGDPDLVRINNQWTPIQAYYAVYSACEAMTHALDGAKAQNHQKTLKKASAFFIGRKLAPWDKAYKEPVGKKRNSHKPVNFLAGITPPHNLQRDNVNPVEMLATCLRAEHLHRVDDLWRSKKHSGCWKYEYDPGHTTVLHFLYRLRLKSNYQEVDLFLSEAPDHEIVGFADSMRKICSWTLSYTEIVLMRKCKKKKIIDLANKYLAMNKRAVNLKKRVDEYATLI